MSSTRKDYWIGKYGTSEGVDGGISSSLLKLVVIGDNLNRYSHHDYWQEYFLNIKLKVENSTIIFQTPKLQEKHCTAVAEI